MLQFLSNKCFDQCIFFLVKFHELNYFSQNSCVSEISEDIFLCLKVERKYISIENNLSEAGD